MQASMRVMFYGLIGFTSGVLVAAENPQKDARAIEEAVAVQVLLDRANFGPGKIDGHYGDFTKKALERYRRAKSSGALSSTSSSPPADAAEKPVAGGAPAAALPEPQPLAADAEGKASGGLRKKDLSKQDEAKDEKASRKAPQEDISDLDLKSVGEVFVNYTVADADVEAVGELPAKPEAKAKLKWLPYTSVAEAVAERFHMDVDFLEELNPGKTKNLKAGDVVRVPNVEPFDLASVKNLKPGTALNAKAANFEESPADEDSKPGESKGKEEKGTAGKGGEKKSGEKKADKTADGDQDSARSQMSVVISKDENMLEVMEDGRMVAAFPVTVGSSETASPVGEWKVKGVAKLPEFRWDEKMLKEGERSNDFYLLPPGPNSPVGVIWIALNKKGVGLHGSDSPDAIGRNVSHGCIRLANWDVLKLATMVKTGVPVSIR